MTTTRRALLPWAAALLAGCAASEPPPLLLTLPAQPIAPGAPSAATTTGAARTLVLRRIGLPEYLLTRRVRYRDSDSSLADWPNARWAERIEVAATREFAEALRARLPGWTVCEGACADGGPGNLVLHVEFGRLDLVVRPGSAQMQAVVQAVWQAPASAGAETRWRDEQRLAFDATAATPQGHAAAVGEALRRVAQALALRLAGTPAR